MNLFVYDVDSNAYDFQNVTIETLTDVNRLKGEATTLKGGVEMEINFEEDYIKWLESPHSVAFSAFNKGDVLIPEDYDSLAMASIYYNVEQTVAFFEEIGLPQEETGYLPTYYLADITIIDYEGEESTMVDNAFYMSVSSNEKGIFIVPFFNLQWVPIPLNSGILTHEYTHAVYDVVVKEALTYNSISESGVNFLYGINEGCADYMAVARTGDSNFMRHSTAQDTLTTTCNDPDEPKPVERDASRVILYSDDIDTAARDLSIEEVCPYDVGSFWASLLYGIAIEIDTENEASPSDEARYKVAIWLMEALVELGNETLEDDFEIWQLVSLFVSRINSAADRAAACLVIEDRYSIYFSEVEGC
ncbi:MAG: hypothetical protein GY762_08010 [Proteobacteria bacterium]|nr:hypothetical protein [Pseudomonadota bacterium]